jgi:hypothetical protein
LRHRLPALLLLLVLIFRISFGWAGVPGGCHHSAPSHASAQVDSGAPPCHGDKAPPCHAHDDATPCHGVHGSTSYGDDCNCDCCHIAVAMVSLGLSLMTVAHEAAVAAPQPVDLTYTPTPAHRPPIA